LIVAVCFMSEMSDSTGIAGQAFKVSAFQSTPGFSPHKTIASRARLDGVRDPQPVGGHLKRVVDVALALIALMLLAPMFGLIAILLRVGLGRPVLVAQHHVGFGGADFTAYTFRTSSASDPTIANCLSSLRDSKLDRLPRLLNILRGEMSFVGPRPVTHDEFSRHGRCASDYLAARPGLVGLRRPDRLGKFGSRGRAALDRYYVRRWSVWLDVVVLANAVVGVREVDDVN
jgi:exopolysaccharide production protein ExoY